MHTLGISRDAILWFSVDFFLWQNVQFMKRFKCKTCYFLDTFTKSPKLYFHKKKTLKKRFHF